jgi:hypothetical protein
MVVMRGHRSVELILVSLVLLYAGMITACSAPALRPCSALPGYESTPVEVEQASARRFHPSRRERECFAAGLQEMRCDPEDVIVFPDGAPLASAGQHCWLVLERGGTACGAERLEGALQECDVESLGAVVPWRGSCAEARAEYGAIANGRYREPVPGPAARLVLYAANLGLRALHPELQAELESLASAEPPSQAELRLAAAAQNCSGDVNPWLGRVRRVPANPIVCGTRVC